MRKIIILLSSVLLALLLCPCGYADSDNGITDIIGFTDGNTIRYEDFGLTVSIPEGAIGNLQKGYMPASYDELDAMLEKDGAAAAVWSDYHTPEGVALFFMQILPCEEGTKDTDVMEYFMKTYPNQTGVKHSERKTIQLGDEILLNCFTAERVDENGTEVKTVIFDRIAGCRRIECMTETYGYDGAEELVKQIFTVDAPVAVQYETSGTVGIVKGDTLRFDDYGVSVILEDNALLNAAESLSAPQSFEELKNSMEKGWYTIFWQDAKSKSGWWSVSANLRVKEAGVTEEQFISGYSEYYKKVMRASKCEIITLPLGDNNSNICLLTTFINGDGEKENLLMLAKVNGDYVLIITVSTYEWQGAKEKAQELLRVDGPKPLPFFIDSSGLLCLRDDFVFGDTTDELESILGSLPAAEACPWWGEGLSCFPVDCDGYCVNVVLDEKGCLYGVICEEVEKEKYDAVFEAAAERFDGIYFYQIMVGNDFFVDHKRYQFYNDDASRFIFALCDASDGIATLSQRYMSGQVEYATLLYMADHILVGELPDLTEEHAVKLLEFVFERCGEPEDAEDLELCQAMALILEGFGEYELANTWMEAAQRIMGG